jgi:catechol-2,3-dioxygenase
MALPAFHLGFGSSTLWQALTTADEGVNRFCKLRLAVNAERLEAMRKFYTRGLNLPLVADDARSLSVQAGRTELSFYADPDGGSPFYHFAFNIPEDKLERAAAWMSPRAKLLQDRRGNHVVHFQWLDAHSIYFRDPAGNLLEFIAHHPLKNGRAGAFDVDDILYASEIGLVTHDVPALGAELDTKLGLTNFAAKLHQPISDVFRPIGDRHGFFIVVKHQRKWLMTDDPAGLFPVGATLHGRERGKLDLANCDCKLSIAG